MYVPQDFYVRFVKPNGIESIESSTFSGCNSLSEITIPSSITKIGGQAFYNCSKLQKIIIPSSVVSIGSEAFSGCCIYDIYCFSSTPPEIKSTPFTYWHSNFHVRKGCGDIYRNTEPWNRFNIIEDAITPCTAPIIILEHGSVKCYSETEGAECHVSYSWAKTNDNNKVVFSPQLVVSAYATAEGYEDSETTTKVFQIGSNNIDNCDVNGDGAVTMDDANIVVNKYLGK